jgi:phosphoenolpyruvate-protein kinase (PTS system EI component)
MIADPKAAILLLGLSFDEFSASPASVPGIKMALRAARYVDARRVAERAIKMTSASEIRSFLTRKLAEMGVPAVRCQW